jgi:hypothetical protein
VKRLRWESHLEQRPPPKHPYRDTAIVYAGMSSVVVIVAALTGGDILKAVLIAGLFFVAATLWTWRSWRNRLRARQAHERNEIL